MLNLRNIVVALGTLLLATALAVLGVIYFADHGVVAQTPGSRTLPPNASGPRSVSQTNPPAPASPASVRTETITYDAWIVNCRETADGKSKKVCSATLPMAIQQQKRVVNVGAWIIAHNNEGALLSVLQTPQIDIGVLIAKGVDLKLGDDKPHKINFVDCNPQRCESTLPMDESLIKELIATAGKPAAITFWKADGAEFTINLQSIRGVDKAIASIR